MQCSTPASAIRCEREATVSVRRCVTKAIYLLSLACSLSSRLGDFALGGAVEDGAEPWLSRNVVNEAATAATKRDRRMNGKDDIQEKKRQTVRQAHRRKRITERQEIGRKTKNASDRGTTSDTYGT